MTEQSLLRFAMILQDQAPTTLEKYICRLTEITLFEADSSLSCAEICSRIAEEFQLSFSPDEVLRAIRKKGKLQIVEVENRYTLSDKAKCRLSESPKIESMLEMYIQAFSVDNKDVDCCDLKELIIRYIYHCFNTNKDNLLSLLGNKLLAGIPSFDATNEEITLLNNFISWDFPSKDRFLYQIIAICYEYCMLTVKKDNLLSKQLFQGKCFFLDSNIIFRMSGINNEDRQYVTTAFMKKCSEVGIQLCCTSATIDEVYRVIGTQVDFIRGLTQNQQPLPYEVLQEINPTEEINDFYKLYYDWTETPGNKYNDFVAFQQYLFHLVEDSIEKLTAVASSDLPDVSREHPVTDFEKRCQSLYQYKVDHRKRRYPSFSSSKTDILNITDILHWRNKNSDSNLWQTNEFLVSADQQLIAWANSNYSGIPIVVLPSVWLSIIMRFSGRTDDDYRSFCLFLNQRQHIDSNDTSINTVTLLRTINNKTSDYSIRKQIVIEVAENKSEYNFDNDNDYEVTVEKAFDKILSKYYGEAEEKLNEVKASMNEQFEKMQAQTGEEIDLKVTAAEEGAIVKLSKNRATQKIKRFKWVKQHSWLFLGFAFVVWIIGFGAWLYEIEPIYSTVIKYIPPKLTEISSQFTVLSMVWTIIIGGASAVMGGFINYMSSSEREDKLYKKYYTEQKKVLREATSK